MARKVEIGRRFNYRMAGKVEIRRRFVILIITGVDNLVTELFGELGV
jgi:hypothetical protein